MNWQRLILDLCAIKPMNRISKEVGVPLWTIRRLKMGETREPKYSDGDKLLSYYYKHVSSL